MIDLALNLLNGTWKFLLLMTSTAPLGVWSFLIAAVFPSVFTAWLSRGVPATWQPQTRDFLLQTVSIAAGILLAWLPWQTLHGFLVGLMAGFMSPYITRAAVALACLFYRVAYKRGLGHEPEAKP